MPLATVVAGNRSSSGASSELSKLRDIKKLWSDFACSEGRGAAAEVDSWLMGATRLPSDGGIKQRVRSPIPLLSWTSD